jgi:hypothetical protein
MNSLLVSLRRLNPHDEFECACYIYIFYIAGYCYLSFVRNACIIKFRVCDLVVFSVNKVWRSTLLMKLLLITLAKNFLVVGFGSGSVTVFLSGSKTQWKMGSGSEKNSYGSTTLPLGPLIHWLKRFCI